MGGVGYTVADDNFGVVKKKILINECSTSLHVHALAGELVDPCTSLAVVLLSEIRKMGKTYSPRGPRGPWSARNRPAPGRWPGS